MSEIIKEENTELLKQILGEVYRESFLETAETLHGVIEQTEDDSIAPVVHHFAPDVYLRQMDAPAGFLAVTMMHKFEHFLIILKGSATVYSEQGLEQFKAPQLVRTLPGTKRIIYFHEDSSWMTVHPTNEKDLIKLERNLIVHPSEEKSFLSTNLAIERGVK